MSVLFAEADLGMFSMFGRIKAPQKEGAHRQGTDSSATFSGL